MNQADDRNADTAQPEFDDWDAKLTEKVMGYIRPMAKRYFRFEVRGLNNVPTTGPALVVSNHSGGMFTMDAAAFACDYYHEFGYSRPIFTLSHDMIMNRVTGPTLRRVGFIGAGRENAAGALGRGGVVIVFPGGDYDVYRPTSAAARIDFNGRTGYVRTALQAGVPIVPAVSIGGQENQLFLSRGTQLAERLGMKRVLRTSIMPVSFGIPFGLSVMVPINLPLPTKIVTEVLPPVDVARDFGTNADVEEVDRHIRSVMQDRLADLAAQRRFPVLG